MDIIFHWVLSLPLLLPLPPPPVAPFNQQQTTKLRIINRRETARHTHKGKSELKKELICSLNGDIQELFNYI